MVVTKGTKKQDREVGRMSRRTAAWLAWSVCGVRSTHGAHSLARLLYRRQFHQQWCRILTKPWSCLCCTDGYALTGVPCGRSDHCLAAPHEPYRLDLLWRRTTLHNAALHPGVRRLRAAREFRISRWGVHGLVLKVGRYHGSSLSGCLRDVAVPRRQSTISSVANRRVDGSLRSGVDSTLRCLLSGRCGYLCLRSEPVRMGRGHRRRTHNLRFLVCLSPHWRNAVMDEQPRCDLLACPSASPSMGR